MKCYLCNSTYKVETTARAIDTVPLCVRCYRLSYGTHWVRWFWNLWYGSPDWKFNIKRKF